LHSIWHQVGYQCLSTLPPGAGIRKMARIQPEMEPLFFPSLKMDQVLFNYSCHFLQVEYGDTEKYFCHDAPYDGQMNRIYFTYVELEQK